MSLPCFVDNNFARDVAISGMGRNLTANCLIDLLKLEMAVNISPWYSRTPTPSNIADDPSRGQTEYLLQQRVKQTDVTDSLEEIRLALAKTAVIRLCVLAR